MRSNASIACEEVARTIWRHPNKPQIVRIDARCGQPHHTVTPTEFEAFLESDPHAMELRHLVPHYGVYVWRLGPFVYNESWVRLLCAPKECLVE